MPIYNRLQRISESKWEKSEQIQEGTVVDIIKNHPDVYGLLYLENKDGTWISGPLIKNGKVWDPSSNVYVSPSYWMKISYPRITDEIDKQHLSLIIEKFHFDNHERISIA